MKYFKILICCLLLSCLSLHLVSSQASAGVSMEQSESSEQQAEKLELLEEAALSFGAIHFSPAPLTPLARSSHHFHQNPVLPVFTRPPKTSL